MEKQLYTLIMFLPDNCLVYNTSRRHKALCTVAIKVQKASIFKSLHMLNSKVQTFIFFAWLQDTLHTWTTCAIIRTKQDNKKCTYVLFISDHVVGQSWRFQTLVLLVWKGFL